MSSNEQKHQAGSFSGPEAIGAISRGLHRAAQPLTVLQGILELSLLKPHTSEEFQGVVLRAMEQSQRVSDYFDHVRQLVHLQESVPELKRFSLVNLVRSVADTFTSSLAANGIKLRMHVPTDGERRSFVMASDTRICSALEVILSSLRDLAGENTTIDLEIKIRSENVQLELKAPKSGLENQKDRVKAPAKHLLLDQVHAMVSSSGGSLKIVERPLAVWMSLPKSQEIRVLSESERIECAHV